MSATLEAMPRSSRRPQSGAALCDMENIGPAIASRLADVGIRTPQDLEAIGSVEAYRRLKRLAGDATVPICYYLYSLEGALRGVHWDHLPLAVKARLVEEAER